ncbi:hypothetical protein OCOJLMKI_4581 [Methylobacterium iners]|uniref:Uncharacterized protein n=1 Tax=Methylobacterium iners TaxID=418707 RepID=A0ABQ4S5C3_9HYPH|nr:hypothetical protein OCOJLMKI_4581 [Methylobacterium iners]
MSTLQNRVRRIEGQRRPALPPAATFVLASNPAAAAQKVAERTSAGTHQPGWPLLVITSPTFQVDRP